VSDHRAASVLVQNEQAKQALIGRVRELVERAPDRPTLLAVHDWKIHDFSSCFSIEWLRQQDRYGVYVKVPKADISRQSVPPSSEGDRVLARHEFASLVYLAKHWPAGDMQVQYVKPLAFYEDCNAIVTERAYGVDVLDRFRREALRSRVNGRADFVTSLLYRIGQALYAFHRNSQASEEQGSDVSVATKIVCKIEQIAADVRSASGCDPLAPALLERLRGFAAHRCGRQPTMTLKGLDIRNVLIHDDGFLSLIDPGRLKKDVPEADIARLFVTCQIIYWGTPWFFLHLQPSPHYERALLEGYGLRAIDTVLLRLLVVKELLKHWRAAYVALMLKRWPRGLKWALSRSYIDGFYSAETARAVRLLRATHGA
jgi:hypothetical protein